MVQIVDKSGHNYNDQSYRLNMTMTTRNSKHMKATPITVEHNLRDQLSKHAYRDMLQDILRHFKTIHSKVMAFSDT